MSLNLSITEKLNLVDILGEDGSDEQIIQNRLETLEKCNYYHPIRVPAQNEKFSPSSGFQLLHHNIRSLVKNGEHLKDFLFNSRLSPNAVLITETWLRDSVPLTQIPNYQFYGQNRSNSTGGGVGIFIQRGEKSSVRQDLMSHNPAMENTCVEIKRDIGKQIIICCIYRPPDTNFQHFMIELQEFLNKASKLNAKIFIGGDFNINLLQYNTDNKVTQFLDLMLSHNFFPTISRPTRVASSSNTLIDCIFTNSLESGTSGILLELSLSDHFPILLEIDMDERTRHSTPNTVCRRRITPERLAMFNQWLEDELADFETLNSPDAGVQALSDAICSGIDHFLPVYSQNRKTHPLKPWITHGILTSINEKNELYKEFLRNKSEENLARFKTYKNRLLKVIRNSRKMYYQDLIEKNRGDGKRTWHTLKEVIGLAPNKSSQIKQITVGTNHITESREISNQLNEFFTTIGPTLERSLPASDLDPTCFIQFDSCNNCFFHPITRQTIQKILSNLEDKGNNVDPMSSSILKRLAPSISPALSHLVNLCFTTGVFPDKLKTAVVTPVFKAGDREDPGNYRPISVMSPLSKIMEKCIYEQLLGYIEHFEIINSSQFGFRAMHSTEHALLTFIDFVVTEKEKGNGVLGIYLDIKKAFDSVNYQILFKKLQKYGIRGLPLQLLKSFLSNRRQQVKLLTDCGDKVMSDEKPIYCGVPQGSVLAPLLFLLYVNDLKNVSEEFQIITFADDTNLFLSGPHLNELFAKANDELKKVQDWFLCNRLCLNLHKTSYQLYTTKWTSSVPELKLNSMIIKRADSVKFLGLTVDEGLSFKQHIDQVCQKFSVAIGLMFRGRNVLETKHLILLYNSLALPHLSYCCLIWAINYPTSLGRLVGLQKRAARVILGLSYCEPVSHRFGEIGVKPLSVLRDLKCMLLLYKIKHRQAPTQVQNLIDWRGPNERLPSLRHRGPLAIKYTRTVYRQHTFRIYAPKLFNTLNNLTHLDFNIPISQFKTAVNGQLMLLHWS